MPLFPACAGVILVNPDFINSASTVPRMRGGDPILYLRRICASLFPACAGVILPSIALYPSKSTVPRMRGGDTICDKWTAFEEHCSPHARG